MSATEPQVTIIIPTRGLRSRGELLQGAIASVLQQRDVRAVPLVVFNGGHCCPEVQQAAMQTPGVQVLSLAAEGIPGALIAGRNAVRTPWFGTLDDDDLLTPDALLQRLALFGSAPELDVVITNGIIRTHGTDALHVPAGHRIASDPLRALRDGNWLLPGSWLARSERADSSLFDGMPVYRECTFLALRFCTEFRSMWSDRPTVIYNAGSPESVSQSPEYLDGELTAARMLLELRLPGHARRMMKWHHASALHSAAERAWSRGDLPRAWQLHRQSLVAWWGVRFLVFTRHLVRSEWQQRAPVASRARPID